MLRQVQQLEEKYKDIAQLKSMKEQVEELKKERVWAEVIDAEKVDQKKMSVILWELHVWLVSELTNSFVMSICLMGIKSVFSF